MKQHLLKSEKAFFVFLETLIYGIAITFAVEWIIRGDWHQVLAWCISSPTVFFLTALFYGGAALFLGFLTSQLWIGSLCVSVVGITLALVSYFKFNINGTPLSMEDFGMSGQLNQVVDVAGNLTLPSVAWICICALTIVTLTILLLQKYLPLGNLRTRFVMMTAEMVILLLFVVGPWAVPLGRACSVDMENRKMVSIAYREYGLTVGLWRDCFLLANKEPEGYSKEYMETVVEDLDRILTQDSDNTAVLQEPPNVIFVLSESFYDMNRLPGLKLSQDPVQNFHRLSQEGVSGQFYTSYLGYGTGYIEMSIFSGLTGKDLKAGTNICFRDDEQYNLLDSVVTPFQKAGYETEMLHAYNNSLYNRTVTYPRLGFNQLLFSPEIQALDLNIQGSPYQGGYYLSDQVFVDALLNRMDTANKKGKPAFLFGISMENHQPFNPEKFGYKCQIDLSSPQLSKDNQDIARVMLEGITRADQALGKLTDSLRQKKEPTIVVFFGDHRPNLFMTDGGTIYSHLGLCKGNDCSAWDINQVADLYSTDYLIWANDAALMQGKAGQKKDTGLLAIGPTLLDAAGMPKTRYWAMQKALSKDMLIDTDLYCVTGEGTPYWTQDEAELSTQDRELLRLRDAIVYDTYYGEQYVTAQMNQPLR